MFTITMSYSVLMSKDYDRKTTNTLTFLSITAKVRRFIKIIVIGFALMKPTILFWSHSGWWYHSNPP